MKRGGFRASRPFGSRSMYSSRRYLDRSPGWGRHHHYGSSFDSWCCFLLCLFSLLSSDNSSYSRRNRYYGSSYGPTYGPRSTSYYAARSTSSQNTTNQKPMIANDAGEKITTIKDTVLCQNCGEKMGPDEQFCANCGAKRPDL